MKVICIKKYVSFGDGGTIIIEKGTKLNVSLGIEGLTDTYIMLPNGWFVCKLNMNNDDPHFELVEFTMSDLKNDDEIKYRHHTTSKVVVCRGLGRLMNMYGGKQMDGYAADMTVKGSDIDPYDIVKVIRNGNVIFDRRLIKEEAKSLRVTMEDLEKKFGRKVEIIR